MEHHARDAVRVAGLTYRQLDHALRSGWLRNRGGGKSGQPRRFTAHDLLALCILRDVLRARIPVCVVAPALRLIQRGDQLPPFDRLDTTAIWTDGRVARVVRPGEARSRPGRAVSCLLDLGEAAARVTTHLHMRKNAAT